MESENQELKRRIETLESRHSETEEKVKQLASVLAGLAQVAQQMVDANSAVLAAIQELRAQRKS